MLHNSMLIVFFSMISIELGAEISLLRLKNLKNKRLSVFRGCDICLCLRSRSNIAIKTLYNEQLNGFSCINHKSINL